MRTRQWSWTVATGCVALLGFAGPAPGQVVQALTKAEVGDWVTYRMTTPGLDGNLTMRQTLTHKVGDEATLKVEVQTNGMTLTVNEMKVPLKGKVDLSTLLPGQNVNAETKQLASGREAVTVAGKKYDCQWVKAQVTAEVMGLKVASVVKFWVSADAPVVGLVRMESDAMGLKTTLELAESGSKKK